MLRSHVTGKFLESSPALAPSAAMARLKGALSSLDTLDQRLSILSSLIARSTFTRRFKGCSFFSATRPLHIHRQSLCRDRLGACHLAVPRLGFPKSIDPFSGQVGQRSLRPPGVVRRYTRGCTCMPRQQATRLWSIPAHRPKYRNTWGFISSDSTLPY